MTIGEKIKARRQSLNITQAKLCGEVITRNMLSEIECGKATPSVNTLIYLAEQLDVPAAYLLSEDDDIDFFEKKKRIEKIKELYSAEKYAECIKLTAVLPSPDDELNYILAKCHFYLGKKSVLSGALITAKEHLAKAKDYSERTIYQTDDIDHLLLMYNALAANIQSPLLEFDIKAFEAGIDPDYELEFYRYIVSDYDYPFKNPIFSKHAEAKRLIKARLYNEALKILEKIINEKNPKTYNSYVMFGVYSDMELCSKQLANFEAAYKYASKRLSMIEGFKA